MRYHCFFEQSGTFKNEFKRLGYEAYDYDIINDFNETDFIIDDNEIKRDFIAMDKKDRNIYIPKINELIEVVNEMKEGK